MALLPTKLIPKGKRRTAMKGSVMADISQGNFRVRKWPDPKGQPKTSKGRDSLDKFRQANIATKYMAPQIIYDFTTVTAGTPLLPRDLLVSMLYNRLALFDLEGGPRMFPMPARIDVSESLDAITQTPGEQLRRGLQMWEGFAPPDTTPQGAIVSRTANQTVAASGSYVAISFTATAIDQAHYWDISNPTKVIIPRDGWYVGLIRAIYVGGTGTFRSIALGRNGVSAFNIDTSLGTTGGSWPLTNVFLEYYVAGTELTLLAQANATNRVWNNCYLILLNIR